MKKHGKIVSLILAAAMTAMLYTGVCAEAQVNVSGTAKPGFTLTADSGAAAYQWYISESTDGEYTAITGAVNSSYLLLDSCGGKFIKVIADGKESEPMAVAEAPTPATAQGKISDQTSENPEEYIFTLASNSEKFSLLDTEKNGESFVLATSGYGAKAYLTTGTDLHFSTSISTGLGYYLNTTVLNGEGEKQLDDGIKNHLVEHEWQTEASAQKRNIPNTYVTKAKLAVLSYTEFNKYYSKFGYGIDGNAWWLRSVSDEWKAFWCGASAGNLGAAPANGVNGVKSVARPCFYLDRDFFTEQKLDLNNTGIAVKTMLAQNYEKSELGAIYDEDELNNIGFAEGGGERIENVCISGTPKPGYTLRASYDSVGGGSVHCVYQWYVSDSYYGDYTEITNAIGSTYVLTDICAGKYVKVSVTPMGTSNTQLAAPMLVEEAPASAAAQTKISDQTSSNPSEYIFTLDSNGEKFSLLDTEENGESFVLAASSYGAKAYLTTGTDLHFSTSISAGLGYYLNTTVLNGEGVKQLDEGIKNHLVEHEWQTEASAQKKNIPNTYVTKAKLAVLSYTEFNKYYKKFGYGIDGAAWWLRSASDEWKTFWCNASAGNLGAAPVNLGNGVARPCFYLDRDFFINERIDLSNSGSKVTEMLRRVYSRSELSNIYTSDELNGIYSSREEFGAENVAIIGKAAVGQKLQGTYTYFNNNESVTEKDTIYKWYVKTGDTLELIPNETQNTYIVRTSDAGKQIVFGVVPRASDGSMGDEVQSEPTAEIKPKETVTVYFDNFADSENNVIDSISDAVGKAEISANFIIENIADTEETVTLIIGVYTASGELKGMRYSHETIAVGKGVYGVSLGRDTEIKSGDVIRGMAWSDFETMNPLCLVIK